MMRIEALDTPALLLDLKRFTANCLRMRERCKALGVRLRPHMKTMKSAAAARLAVDPHFPAITVATLGEAEYFAQHGFSDIFYAVCLAPSKLPQVLKVAAQIERFSVLIESVETARALAQANPQRALEVWIEVESGGRRTGVAPESEELLAIARAISNCSRITLRGVATHAGHSYDCRSIEQVRVVAEQERSAATLAATRVRAAGIQCPEVSVGSTPTATHARSLEGVKEVRAGVYMAGDLTQVALSSCRFEDVSVSVLSTVLSHRRDPDQITIDAGGLALSKDRGPLSLGVDTGFGQVVDLRGLTPFGQLFVGSTHQEHGLIRGPARVPFEELPLGAKVRVLPNHACMTADAHELFHVIDSDRGVVVDQWEKTTGWR